MVTLLQLMACTGARKDRAENLLSAINEAMDKYEINTPARIGMFLSNVGHESGGLKWLIELWGPTDAQRRYEGRHDLGNLHIGDGFRFRGRGLLQTTGRANYKKMTERVKQMAAPDEVTPNFEISPELLSQPKWAAVSAADYWNMRKLNSYADRGAFIDVVKIINGGTNGLTDRLKLWGDAQRALAL